MFLYKVYDYIKERLQSPKDICVLKHAVALVKEVSPEFLGERRKWYFLREVCFDLNVR